jgi:DNA mismatch repair protein MutL
MGVPSHIRVLPAHVINKIAAGEVVERPASVLKELMENALDAGASQMDVEIAAGGRKLVAVRDNGSGMGRDDAILSVERHATSKIQDVDDIEKISTLGFRGEALAAIASVCRFRVLTCRVGETAGTEILITGGKMADVRDAGCPTGTAVEVRDLFFNVPARRKFLRSQETELAHVREMFIVQALSHPTVGMSLKVDGRETYRLAGGASLEDRLRDLFGADYIRNLKPVDLRAGNVSVHGYVSIPTVSRSDRNEQYVFVNSRATSAPVLGYAIREGYHTLLPGDRHPSIFLLLDMDPEEVDVNVHPTKKEVRFRHPNDIRDTVINAIRQALASERAQSASIPRTEIPSADSRLSRPAVSMPLRIEDLPPTRTFIYPRMVTGPGSASVGRDGAKAKPDQKASIAGQKPEESAQHANTEPEGTPPSSPWMWCRIVGQIGGLYVVLETEDGYVLMDPHAAHERILFERFMSDFVNGKIQTQGLLIPETVDLMPKDAIRIRKNLELFKKMGFGISEFGGDSFVVDSLPSCFSGVQAGPLLLEIAHTMEEAGARGAAGRWREEAIAQAACKASVKARDKLKLDEIEKLVTDLARTEMPYTCPHGRPTLIFTSFRDLNKKFGRE